MSVANRMGAPSRRPAAKPMVQALSRSLICASVGMPDGGCEDCVRRDWALPKPQRANETITTTTSLVLNVIGTPLCSFSGVDDQLCARHMLAGRSGFQSELMQSLPAAVWSFEVRIRLQRFRSFPRLFHAGRCGHLIKFPCLLGVP